jgi:hypothetical protein
VAAAAATALIGETAAGSDQQQHCLRLRSFSSSLPKAVDMLAVLQVQHLTRVELSLPRDAVIDSFALSVALARLSNLQQLRLGNMSDASLEAALTTLVQLPQLTSLTCNGEWPSDPQAMSLQQLEVLAIPVSLALQQLLAQPLPLRSLQLPGFGSYQLPRLNMALLTNLTQLSTGSGVLEEATVLPAQLQRLHIHSHAGTHSMAPLTRLELKQLQHLSVRVDFEQPQLLLLAQLPALTHLALQYDERSEKHGAAATASLWPMLPQLRQLEVAHGMGSYRQRLPTQPQWEAILAGAAAAAGLTKLVLDARMLSNQAEERFDYGSDPEEWVTTSEDVESDDEQ